MSKVKEGDWVEVVGGNYLITAEGSIGFVVSDPQPRLWRGGMQGVVDVLFYYASSPPYPDFKFDTTTFDIRVEDLKVIDKETAMRKIAAGYL